MNPLLHRGNKGVIRGFHVLDALGGLGVVHHLFSSKSTLIST